LVWKFLDGGPEEDDRPEEDDSGPKDSGPEEDGRPEEVDGGPENSGPEEGGPEEDAMLLRLFRVYKFFLADLLDRSFTKNAKDN